MSGEVVLSACKERGVRVEEESWRRNHELRWIEIKDSRIGAYLSKESRLGELYYVFTLIVLFLGWMECMWTLSYAKNIIICSCFWNFLETAWWRQRPARRNMLQNQVSMFPLWTASRLHVSRQATWTGLHSFLISCIFVMMVI